MTKHFVELEAKMSPEARARSDALHRKYVTEMPLNDSPPSKAYASVWDVLSDTAAEAANLKVRSELMQQLATLIQERGSAGAEAVRHSGIDPSRVDDLLRGSISRLTLDTRWSVLPRNSANKFASTWNHGKSEATNGREASSK